MAQAGALTSQQAQAVLNSSKAQVTSELKQVFSSYSYAAELKKLALDIVKRRIDRNCFRSLSGPKSFSLESD